MKGFSRELVEKIQNYDYGELKISSITYAELEICAQKSSFPEKSRIALMKLFIPFEVVAFDSKAAVVFGSITADLEKKGMKIGSYDSLIAAHALSNNYSLVTNNTKEFTRVHELKVENWVQ